MTPDSGGEVGLRDWLAQVVSAMVDSKIEWNEQGNLPVRMGSAQVFVRPVEGDPVMVLVFSQMLRDVKESPELFEAINEINRQFSYGQAVLTPDGQIVLSRQLLAESISPADVAYSTRWVTQAADYYDTELQSRFGGLTYFEGR